MTLEAENIDKLLLRQLKKAGLANPLDPPDAETWQRILSRVNELYVHAAQDRDMLTRSLELSTAEMESLNRRVSSQHSGLRDVLDAVSAALDVLHEATSDRAAARGLDEVTQAVTTAKSTLSSKLDHIPAGSESQGVTTALMLVRRHFSGLAEQVVGLLQQKASGESLRKEVEVAKTVQKLLFPEADTFERPYLRLAGHFQPAADCSGDWWTVHDLPDGRILIVVGDVTGHGIAPAIMTGAAKAACDLARTLRGGALTLEELLSLMNRTIEGVSRQQLLMTAVASVIDPRDRSMTFASAGHRAPVLVRASGSERVVHQLRCHGAPLGATRDSVYGASTVKLEPGDVVFWCTDGLLETENAQGEQFGEKRLKATLQHVAQWTPVGMRDALNHAMSRFSAGARQNDDVTFVLARVSDS